MANTSWHHVAAELEDVFDEYNRVMLEFEEKEAPDKRWLKWFSEQGIVRKALPNEAEPAVSSPDDYAALARLTIRRDALKQDRAAALSVIQACQEKLAGLANQRLAFLEQHRKIRLARIVLSILIVLLLGYALFR